MNKDLIAIFDYLEKEKGIQREIVLQAIEEALQSAAQKSVQGATNVIVKIHPKTAVIDVLSEKQIVEKVVEPNREISLTEALELDPECSVGQYIDVIVTPRDFGRIAAQKARQIITQKLRTAEKDVIYEEFRHRIGELITGIVKRFFRGSNLVIDLGKVEAIMPMKEYPKTEKYQIGDRVLCYLLTVQDTESGGAEVILSRSAPEFVLQLFIQEVPELHDGTIVVDRIVREGGYRTKLTVRSTDPKVDPVGACVGVRGNRVKNVVREVHNEKIDIIPFSDDPVQLLQNALAPIEIRKINVNEDEKVIAIVIDDEDYAAVIGRRGMNARLNGRLIGYEIDVQRMTEYNMARAIQRTELALSGDPILDQELEGIIGVQDLVFKHLYDEGFTTTRSLLQATTEVLAEKTNISLEMADYILEQIRKKEVKVGKKSKDSNQERPTGQSSEAGGHERESSQEEANS